MSNEHPLKSNAASDPAINGLGPNDKCPVCLEAATETNKIVQLPNCTHRLCEGCSKLMPTTCRALSFDGTFEGRLHHADHFQPDPLEEGEDGVPEEGDGWYTGSQDFQGLMAARQAQS
jgi:hypothetical protein